jgi:hypothetical protein
MKELIIIVEQAKEMLLQNLGLSSKKLKTNLEGLVLKVRRSVPLLLNCLVNVLKIGLVRWGEGVTSSNDTLPNIRLNHFVEKT